MSKFYQPISMEDAKVNFFERDGQKLVRKKTSELEAVQSVVMKHMLTLFRTPFIKWGQKSLSVRVPEIISWFLADGHLEMQFCCGENYESVLRRNFSQSRPKFVNLIGSLFEWMRLNGIVWRDAAPRNMLLDSKENILTLLDFERPLVFNNKSFGIKEFTLLIRGNVHEEFAAFLMPQEQVLVFPNIWDDVGIDFVPKSFVSSNRQMILLEHLFGQQEAMVKVSNLVTAQKMMVNVITPFQYKNKILFPLVYLASIKTPEKYIEKVIELNSKARHKWIQILTN